MVGDQEAADARLDCPGDVLDRVGELAHAPELAEVGRTVGRARMGTDTPALTGPDEEGHLDSGGVPERSHLTEFGLGQQHRAAALRDAVDDDVVVEGGGENRLEDARPLHARDLDAEVGTVGKPQAARRGQLRRRRGQAVARDCRVSLQRRPLVPRAPSGSVVPNG